MSTKLLLAELRRLSDAPKAIPKFRDFVRRLAVSGCILETDLREWSDRSLGEVGTWGSGGTPNKAHHEYYDGDIPWLVIGDLNDGLVTAAAATITEDGLANSSAKIVEPGTVLVAMYGSIGKLGLAGIRCATNQAIAHCIVDSALITSDYLMLALRSMRSELLARGQGGTQPNISQTILKPWPISLPPINEQQQIVARVDELMALCDQLERAQKDRELQRDALRSVTLYRVTATGEDAGTTTDVRLFLDASPRIITKPDHVAPIRETILNLAVSGHLVPQSSEEQPAEKLLRQFELEEGSSSSLRRVRSSAPVALLSQEGLPSGWVNATISQAFRVTGGIQKQPKRFPAGNAFPYLGVSNVQRGRLDLSSVSRFELFPGELDKYCLVPGDLLVVEGNGSPSEIGRCARWNGEIAECVHQNHIIRCRPLCKGIEQFVLLFLNSPSGTATMRKLAITSAGLYSLSVGKIRRITIPVPPLAEQHRIVAKVNELMAVCDELEQALTSAEYERGRLLEALLHEALAEGRSTRATGLTGAAVT